MHGHVRFVFIKYSIIIDEVHINIYLRTTHKIRYLIPYELSSASTKIDNF